MWYEYFDNASLLTTIYTQVPSLNIFRLAGINLQREPSLIRLRGDLSHFPDASLDWQPPYNTIQVTLELSVIRVTEFTMTKPPFDLTVNITIDESDEQQLLFWLTSSHCVLRVYFSYAKITSVSKYIHDTHSR